MLAGLLRSLKLCGSTDAAPCWYNLLHLTHLTYLSVNDAADVGAMSELSHMPGLHTLDLADYSFQVDTVKNLLHLQSLFLTSGSDEVCNLESCTQLTRLEARIANSSFCHLVELYGCSICTFVT